MSSLHSSDRPDGGLDALEILDALARAIIVTEPDGRILVWNHQAEQLYGWAEEEVRGRQVADVLVEVGDRDAAASILEAVPAGNVWEGDCVVLRRNGEPVRVWVRGAPVLDGSGRVRAIVASSEDVSERRLLEQQAADLTEHLRLALDAGGLGTFRRDLETGVMEWDARMHELFGLDPSGQPGPFEARLALIHPDDREQMLRVIDEAVAQRSSYGVGYRVLRPDGTVRWLAGSGRVTVDADGRPTGTIGCARDVTDEIEAEEERARATAEALAAAEAERIHRERLEFLARINDALAAATTRQEVMANVGRAAVPRLGDWCSVFVLVPGSDVPEVETAHLDPAMVAYAKELQQRFPYDPAATSGMAKVIRTGEMEVYRTLDEAAIGLLDASDEERDIVRDLELWSSIAVPLVKNGRIIGGLQLVMTRSRRNYTEEDVTLVEAVAARVGSSLENMRLSEEQRSIASTLQASLLPVDLPAIGGVQTSVRYWASGEGVEVGGDFYDVFRISPGRWGVVVGDVCGKGPRAAAITGMARHTIASAAWHGDEPATVLENLNRAILERHPESFCTAVYGTLDARPGGSRLTFACGGHPLPIAVRADGTVETIGSYGMLIGAFDQLGLVTTIADFGPGDTLVLYTDGVTDVPPPNGITGEEFTRLVATASVQTATAEELADHLQEELASILAIEERDDDIALLILRF
jgi:PAS domain S-box-containing protein